MTVRIRLPRPLYEGMIADLRRPHAFALERVGFLFGRLANSDAGPLVLMTNYMPLADERYVDDSHVGARIDSQAIRSAMQGVLDRDEGVFHVHLHEQKGRPAFSFTDWAELPRLVKSFQTVGRQHPHGLFLLSSDQAHAEVWLPGQSIPVAPARIAVVGFPLSLIGGCA